ncbi:kinase-like domain-containing protein [Cunninghamella echinulata]|nr:kinase-like domain-containing protein [Cunninghamella echinulata]
MATETITTTIPFIPLKEEDTVIETGYNDSTIRIDDDEDNKIIKQNNITKRFLIDYNDKKIKRQKKTKKKKPLLTTHSSSITCTPTISTTITTTSYLKQPYHYISSFFYSSSSPPPPPPPLPPSSSSLSIDQSYKPTTPNNNQSNLTLEQKYGTLQSTSIGKGAYANVKLITNHQQQSIYAVKIFKNKKNKKNNRLHEKKIMKKITGEYCIASSLNHPNIVETFDFLKNKYGHYCMVMEYCTGGDLYHAIERDQLTLCKMKSYFKQLLLGLDYLHSLGVAHRDIKPENLMLSKDGKTLKITDFGVAEVFCEKWQRHCRLSSGFVGSLAFIAPEIFLHHQEGYQAMQVDVWSAAMVFCCMWLKGTLFQYAEKSDAYYRLFLKSYSTRSFKTLSSINDSDFRSLIYLMLNPNPHNRIQISTILKLSFISNIAI